MLARVFSAAVNGVDAYPIEVEVNSGFGESLIVIVAPIYLHRIFIQECQKLKISN